MLQNFLERLRRIDVRKLSPLQLVLGVAGVVIIIWMVAQIINLALSLLPIAIGVVALYVIFRVLTSERPEEEAGKAIADVQNAATRSADRAMAEVERVRGQVKRPAAAPEPEAEETTVAPLEAEDEPTLAVEQVTDPETGIKEANLSRLEEMEQKPSEVDDDVMAQIEARRKRLLGDQDNQ